MTARRLLLALPAATALVVLPACGSDDDVRGTAATAGSTAGGASSSSPDAAGAGTTAAADVELEDQSGDGTTVQVARVSALEDGFVVISLDEDDGGEVLGWSAVATGVLDGAQLDLDTPVPAATGDDDGTEITATLYADTDGDGAWSAGDVAVAEPRDGGDDDGDGDDVVDDDAGYRVA